MAVSGSGGWIPSRGVWVRDRTLHIHSMAQNKPRDIVHGIADAALILAEQAPGTVVQVDTRNGNIPALWRALRDAGLVDGMEGRG